METIRKTGVKATYLKGNFYLRSDENWANPINFPTVFTAYGQAIRNGNWQSCTAINTPQYVIDNYFGGKMCPLRSFWNAVFAIEQITWEDVNENKQDVLRLINNANNELLRLEAL